MTLSLMTFRTNRDDPHIKTRKGLKEAEHLGINETVTKPTSRPGKEGIKGGRANQLLRDRGNSEDPHITILYGLSVPTLQAKTLSVMTTSDGLGQ
jgi:hypothetical protein